MNDKPIDFLLTYILNPNVILALQADLAKVTPDNSGIRNEEYYYNLDIVKNAFRDPLTGELDKEAFHNQYVQIQKVYTDWASKGFINSLYPSFRNTVWAVNPSYLRLGPDTKLSFSPNPDGRMVGWGTLGKIEPMTKSKLERAEGNKVFNKKTGKWDNVTPDSWGATLHYINDTLVLAVDENGVPKLDENGKYYFEILGPGENILGKQVLHWSDMLTPEDHWTNAIDFFDSDLVEAKGFFPSLLKNAILVLPMLFPLTRPLVAIPHLALQLIGIGGTFGRMLSESSQQLQQIAGVNLFNTSGVTDMFANLEGLSEKYDLLKGRTEEALLNFFSLENILGFAGEITSLVMELRYIFETVPKIYAKWTNKPDVTTAAGRQAFINRVSKDFTTLMIEQDSKLLSSSFWKNIGDVSRGTQLGASTYAEMALQKAVQNYQKIGADIARLYMVGLVTNLAYREARQDGATPIEAALLTLGYSFFENKLLKSEIGQHMFPELREEKALMAGIELGLTSKVDKTNLAKMMRTSGVTPVAASASAAQKEAWYTKLLNIGKNKSLEDIARGNNVFNKILYHGLAEASEEVSEEFLYDVSRSIYNAVDFLVGTTTGIGVRPIKAFNNMLERYGTAFIGGFLGGSMASGSIPRSTDYSNMTYNQASLAAVNLIHNGKKELLVNFIKSHDVFDKNISTEFLTDEDGNTVPTSISPSRSSLNSVIKDTMLKQIDTYESIINSNDAMFSDSNLIDINLKRGIAAAYLSSINVDAENTKTAHLLTYLFGKLVTDLVNDTLLLRSLLGLDDRITDSSIRAAEEAEQESKSSNNSKEGHIEQKEIIKLQEKIAKTRLQIKNITSGNLAEIYMEHAIFEMNPVLHNFMRAPITLESLIWINSGKTISELTPKEIEDYKKLYLKVAINNATELLPISAEGYRKLSEESAELLKELETAYTNIDQNSVEELARITNDFTYRLNNLLSLNSTEQGLKLALTLDLVFSALGNTGFSSLAIMAPNYGKNKLLQDWENYSNLVQEGQQLQLEIAETLDKIVKLEESYKVKPDEVTEKPEVTEQPEITEETPEVTEEETTTEETTEETTTEKETSVEEETPVEASPFSEWSEADINTYNEQKNKLVELQTKLDANKVSVKEALNNILTNVIEEFDPNTLTWGNTLVDDAVMALFASEDLPEELKEKLNKKIPNVNDFLLRDRHIAIQILGKFILKLDPKFIDILELINIVETGLGEAALDFDAFTLGKQGDTLYKLLENAIYFADLLSAVITGARTDNYALDNPISYNGAVNLFSKRAKLPTINGVLADAAIAELQALRERFRTAINILNVLLGKDIAEVNNIEKNTILVLYNTFRKIVFELPDDNEHKLPLKTIINSFSVLNNNIDKIGTDAIKELNEETSTALLKAYLDFGHSLYKYASKLKEGKITSLILNFIDVLNLLEKTDLMLTSATKSLEPQGFIYTLTGMLTTDIAETFKKIAEITENDVIPMFNLILSILTIYAFLINNELFHTTYEALRNKYISIDPKNVDSLLFPSFANLFFIDGIAGSGKTTAIINTILRIIKKYHSEEEPFGTIFVHAAKSTSEATKTGQNIGIELGMSKADFMLYISNDWKERAFLRPLPELQDCYTKLENGERISNLNITSLTTPPKVIFIDEISQFSFLELSTIDLWAKLNGVKVITAGDFCQSVLTGIIKFKEGETERQFNIKPAQYFFIHGFKLGNSLRAGNNIKTANAGILLNLVLGLSKFEITGEASDLFESMQNRAKKRGETDKNGDKIAEINLNYAYQDDKYYGDMFSYYDNLDEDSVPSYDYSRPIEVISNMVRQAIREGKKITLIRPDLAPSLYLKKDSETEKEYQERVASDIADSSHFFSYIWDTIKNDPIIADFFNSGKTNLDLFEFKTGTALGDECELCIVDGFYYINNKYSSINDFYTLSTRASLFTYYILPSEIGEHLINSQQWKSTVRNIATSSKVKQTIALQTKKKLLQLTLNVKLTPVTIQNVRVVTNPVKEAFETEEEDGVVELLPTSEMEEEPEVEVPKESKLESIVGGLEEGVEQLNLLYNTWNARNNGGFTPIIDSGDEVFDASQSALLDPNESRIDGLHGLYKLGVIKDGQKWSEIQLKLNAIYDLLLHTEDISVILSRIIPLLYKVGARKNVKVIYGFKKVDFRNELPNNLSPGGFFKLTNEKGSGEGSSRYDSTQLIASIFENNEVVLEIPLSNINSIISLMEYLVKLSGSKSILSTDSQIVQYWKQSYVSGEPRTTVKNFIEILLKAPDQKKYQEYLDLALLFYQGSSAVLFINTKKGYEDWTFAKDLNLVATTKAVSTKYALSTKRGIVLEIAIDGEPSPEKEYTDHIELSKLAAKYPDLSISPIMSAKKAVPGIIALPGVPFVIVGFNVDIAPDDMYLAYLNQGGKEGPLSLIPVTPPEASIQEYFENMFNVFNRGDKSTVKYIGNDITAFKILKHAIKDKHYKFFEKEGNYNDMLETIIDVLDSKVSKIEGSDKLDYTEFLKILSSPMNTMADESFRLALLSITDKLYTLEERPDLVTISIGKLLDRILFRLAYPPGKATMTDRAKKFCDTYDGPKIYYNPKINALLGVTADNNVCKVIKIPGVSNRFYIYDKEASIYGKFDKPTHLGHLGDLIHLFATALTSKTNAVSIDDSGKVNEAGTKKALWRTNEDTLIYLHKFIEKLYLEAKAKGLTNKKTGKIKYEEDLKTLKDAKIIDPMISMLLSFKVNKSLIDSYVTADNKQETLKNIIIQNNKDLNSENILFINSKGTIISLERKGTPLELILITSIDIEYDNIDGSARAIIKGKNAESEDVSFILESTKNFKTNNSITPIIEKEEELPFSDEATIFQTFKTIFGISESIISDDEFDIIYGKADALIDENEDVLGVVLGDVVQGAITNLKEGFTYTKVFLDSMDKSQLKEFKSQIDKYNEYTPTDANVESYKQFKKLLDVWYKNLEIKCKS